MDVIHTAIWVDDIDEMLEFYVDALGLERTHSFTSDGVENVYVGGGDAEIQFRHSEDHDAVSPDRAAMDHLAVGVDDVDATFERMVDETGCEIVDEPRTNEQAGARVAFVEDPQGYVLELVQAE